MQGFTPNAPATNSLGVSQIVRDNFSALLSQHAGPALPAYAVEGMPWYDSFNHKMTIVKARGTKAFAQVPCGAAITVCATLRLPGTNGATVPLDARIQDVTLLPGDKDFSGGRLYFSTAKTPAYFAAKQFVDPLINDPILFTTDGVLSGKTWESLVPATHETVYAAGVWSNEAHFEITTLRAVDVEGDWTNWELDIVIPGGADHFVANPSILNWHDVQEGGGKMTLLKDGVEMNPLTYRIKPFMYGSVQPSVAVYSVEPVSGISLVPFVSTSRYTLRIRKPS